MKYLGILCTCTCSLLFLVLCSSRSDASVLSFGVKDMHGNEVALKDLSGNVRELFTGFKVLRSTDGNGIRYLWLVDLATQYCPDSGLLQI